MRQPRVVLLIGVIVLLAAAMACSISVQTPAPMQTPTSTPTPTVQAAQVLVSPTISPTVTPLPDLSPTPTRQPTPTSRPTLTPTATPNARARMARFDEAAGLFSVRYPIDFNQVRRLASGEGRYGYAFATAENDAMLVVGFTVMSDKPMPDGEWSMTIGVLAPQTLLKEFDDSIGAEFKEVNRREGEAGEHTLHWEGESADGELHNASYMEESKGVIALIVLIVPASQWSERQEQYSESIKTFSWSPELVRGQAGERPKESERAPDIVIEPSPSPAISDTVTFEDTQGVFSFTYPADFGNAQGPTLDEGQYTFTAWIGDESSHYLGVSFILVADQAYTDAEWEAAVDGVVQAVVSNVAKDATEVFRSEGDPGEHWVYVEAESKSEKARAFYYVEEADGVLGMVIGQVPSAEWADWEERLVAAVNSFRWWSEAARRVLESAPTATPGAADETPIPSQG